MEAHADELAALESLDNGKPLYMSKIAGALSLWRAALRWAALCWAGAALCLGRRLGERPPALFYASQRVLTTLAAREQSSGEGTSRPRAALSRAPHRSWVAGALCSLPR